MFVRKSDPEHFTEFYNTLCEPVLPWKGVVASPFSCSWCVLRPGERSRLHNHHEGEVFLVVEGSGRITVGDETAHVASGDLIYLAPFENHELENLSRQGTLTFLSAWWEDPALAAERAQPKVGQDSADPSTTLVTATPPTPNGDLHLGHLSGPYLGADIFTRFLRLRGRQARYVTGVDDNQSYVPLRAEAIGTTPSEVAADAGRQIRQTLDRGRIAVDFLLEPSHEDGYTRFVQEFFRKLYDEGKVVRRETPALYSEPRGHFVAEAFVRGQCPHCESESDGNACEACGRPNDCVDLKDPVCKTSGSVPVQRRLEKIYFPLAPYEAQLRAYYARVRMNPHLRALCDSMLADGLPDIAITHETEWGIPVPVDGFASQRLYVWFEMAAAYLFMGGKAGGPDAWRCDGGDVVQFFGFDNGYFHAVLFPALFMAYDETLRLPSTFVTNEFYRLEGIKFSTSRRHAIWGGEFLETYSSDSTRFYLSYTGPEVSQTSFGLAEFKEVTHRELITSWNRWLETLDAKLTRLCGRVVPEPGAWLAEHKAFYAELCNFIEVLFGAYSSETFSPQRAARSLCELVRICARFGEAQDHLHALPQRHNEARTAIALELAGAKTLAILCAPILPDFASRLWQALGYSSAVFEATWEDAPAFVPGGRKIATLPHLALERA
jgi:methionyl-tRNA synthetase